MTRQSLMPRSHYKAWREVPTRWADNDAYGHVNNSVYYFWFDTAVNLWLLDAGLLDVNKGSLIGLVVETGCRYARPLAFPEPVDIGLAVMKIGKSSVQYQLGAFSKNEDEPAAEARFVHVYVDRATRRPSALPDLWRTRLATIAA